MIRTDKTPRTSPQNLELQSEQRREEMETDDIRSLSAVWIGGLTGFFLYLFFSAISAVQFLFKRNEMGEPERRAERDRNVSL
jgi:hypothetical protein